MPAVAAMASSTGAAAVAVERVPKTVRSEKSVSPTTQVNESRSPMRPNR